MCSILLNLLFFFRPALTPDYTKLPFWLSYIEFEENNNDPARVICIYERAIKSLCLAVDLWTRYVLFLESKMKNVTSLILETYQRAVKNCPWSGVLWAGLFRILERTKSNEDMQGLILGSLVWRLKT